MNHECITHHDACVCQEAEYAYQIEFRNRRIAELEHQLAEAQAIIENDCENEAAARKAAGPWDRSSPEGVEPLADIIERLILRMTEDQAEISRLYKTLDGLRAETLAAGVAWDDERLRLHDAINNLHDAINNWHKIADERSAEIIRLQETISEIAPSLELFACGALWPFADWYRLPSKSSRDETIKLLDARINKMKPVVETLAYYANSQDIYQDVRVAEYAQNTLKDFYEQSDK